MKIKVLNKSCPNCKSTISLKFYRNREEIIPCPNCKSLLAENPKRKMTSGIIIFIGIVLTIVSATLKVPIYLALIILLVSFGVALKVVDLTIVKKDLIIRNKHTNQISYVDNSDWKEIIQNAAGKENNFEIVEYLNT